MGGISVQLGDMIIVSKLNCQNLTSTKVKAKLAVLKQKIANSHAQKQAKHYRTQEVSNNCRRTIYWLTNAERNFV